MFLSSLEKCWCYTNVLEGKCPQSDYAGTPVGWMDGQ